MGYIYILTNPSFPQYVKIGYANDVNQRVNELNSSSAVPFAFRIYATYQVESNLSDKKLHGILDKLNPDLRTTETVNGKNRVREFYAMSPEDAYDILLAIAEINNYKDRLKKYSETAAEKEDEKNAQEIDQEYHERASAFAFSKCGIPIGDTVQFSHRNDPNDGVACIVVDDKHVKYQNEIWTLSALATNLLQSKWSVQGPSFFKYNGEWLNDIRKRLGK